MSRTNQKKTEKTGLFRWPGGSARHLLASTLATVVVLALASCCPPENCEPPRTFCDLTMAEVRYDVCLLPDDPGQEFPWGMTGSNAEPYSEDCSLVMPAADELEFVVYRRSEESLAAATGYTMEARLRVEQYLEDRNELVNASFGVGDGNKAAYIHLTHMPAVTTYSRTCNQEECEDPAQDPRDMTFAVVCDEAGCHYTELDWTVPHDYRIEVTKEGPASFFIDGHEFHEVEYRQLRAPSTQQRRFGFGAAESLVYWEDVRYEVCGPTASN